MSTSTSTNLVTQENVNNVIEEIETAFFDIPFENSAFQTEAFVIGGSITPERAYRNIGLRMQNRLEALREAKYGRAKEDIEIEELQATIDFPDATSFEIRKAQLEIDHKLAGRRFGDKLINDALAELNVLYAHFKGLPKFTREQFEAGERLHFETKLNRQINNLQGPAEALVNMDQDIQRLTSYEEQHLLLASQPES